MHIIGTAGHVDHGKSALVRALTGTNPDRWLEEQRRGMTLDLGFAHLRFPDGTEAGIIDVPGHERFLHNMLAGAAGMELVLLVVAANEGIMPQTREHLAILGYLNARSAIVVISKSDTADAAGIGALRAQLRKALRDTFAGGAPIVAVSTLTGAGLPELRDTIHAALAALPPRAPHAPPYLPVDRVFARAGHGTVVTGTLMQGRIAIGDTLELSPGDRQLRVRGLQVFGEKHESVAGGARVAVNVAGIDTAHVARGAVLASPQLRPATSFDVRFRPLRGTLDMLKRRMPVRVYLGSAEILGTLVFARTPTDTEAVDARLHLRTPAIAIPHAPFVVRRVSPMNVLGGGTVAASAAKVDAEVFPDRDAPQREAVLAAVAAAGLRGASSAAIGAAANLDLARASAIIADLIADGRIRALAKPAGYLAADVADEFFSRALAKLHARQQERPWLLGLTSIALAQALSLDEPTLVRVMTTFVESGAVTYRGGYYATVDFTPRLTPEQRAFFDGAFTGPAAAPVSFEELRARIKSSSIHDLSAAFETLVAGGALSKVGDFVYLGTQLTAIRAQLETALRREGKITVAEFRTLTQTSRKYAVPLLEFFDATGFTLRSGDVRVLRRTPPATATNEIARISADR